MAVFILISGIMGVFAVAVGWYLYLPVVIELFNLPQWHEAPNTPNTCLLYTSPSPRDS